MSDADLARRVRDRRRLTGRFALRSGRLADEYFDKYQFEAEGDCRLPDGLGLRPGAGLKPGGNVP